MKILLISAGTKKDGATERAVTEAEKALKNAGALCQKFNLFSHAIASCNGCGKCIESGRCIRDDEVLKLCDIAGDFDGFIFFSPVHYGGASGNLKSAMGRLFYSRKKVLEYKPAAAVAVSRRGGNVTALEEMTRFFSFASMPCVSGNYPGTVHGTSSCEAEKDEEGLQTVRSIAENMVWLIRCIECAKDIGLYHPIPEDKIKTSYIR